MLRIAPGFIVASVVSVFVFGQIAQAYRPNFTQLLILCVKNIFKIHEVEYTVPLRFLQHPLQLNGPLWTIKWEIACYLLAGIAGVIGLSRNRWAWLGIFLMTFSVWIMQLQGIVSIPTNLVEAPRLVTCFASGSIFYLYRNTIKYSYKLVVPAALGLAVCLRWETTAGLGIATLGAYILFAAAFAKMPTVAKIGTKNDVSYGLYLYAWPIQQTLTMYWPNAPLVALFVSALCLSSLAGFLSWRLVESPALRLKRNLEFLVSRVSNSLKPAIAET